MCNTGYEIQAGDPTRTCQSDGMFNGTMAMCNRGNEWYLNFVAKSNYFQLPVHLSLTLQME